MYTAHFIISINNIIYIIMLSAVPDKWNKIIDVIINTLKFSTLNLYLQKSQFSNKNANALAHAKRLTNGHCAKAKDKLHDCCIVLRVYYNIIRTSRSTLWVCILVYLCEGLCALTAQVILICTYLYRRQRIIFVKNILIEYGALTNQ